MTLGIFFYKIYLIRMILNKNMKKHRNTHQRMIIKDYLKDNKTHPSAFDIYRAVRKKIPNVSFATVYNNIEIMLKNGELIEINDGRKKRFDPDISQHDHFICIKCGKIFDIESSYQNIEIKKPGFKVIYHTTYFKGLCEKCNK